MSTIYALVKRMNLVLLLMCIVQVPRVMCQDMKFVYPIKDMSISTEKDEFPMTFRMNISSDISFVLGLLENIKTELMKIEKIPGVQGQVAVNETMFRSVRQSVVVANSTAKKLKLITKYVGPTEIVPNELCAIEVQNNLDLQIFAAERMITNSVLAVGLDHGIAEMAPGKEAYINVLNVLQDSYLHLRTIEGRVSDMLEKLEALTSGQISPAIYSSAQLDDCILEGEADKLTLKKCVKTTTGLLCYLDVEIYTKNEKYLTYIPVNYNGVQILLPDKKILAKSTDGTYGLLSCRDEEEELINDCIFNPWEFTEKLMGPNPESYLYLFNFTLAEPPLPLQTVDGSVLIMDKRVRVSIRDGQAGDKDINNVSPMSLSFSASSTVTTILDKTKLKFKAGSLDRGFEIVTSSLNATIISVMHEKALRDAVRDMDWNNIFKYLSFIIQVLVMPVAVTSCSLSLYAVVRSVLSRRRRKKKEKMAQKYNLRRNYEMNKRMAKKMRREAP